MVSLKDAIRVTQCDKDECVFLRKAGAGKYDDTCMTVKEVLEKYDLKNTEVISISTKFFGDEFAGFVFEVKDRIRDKRKDGTREKSCKEEPEEDFER